MFIRVQMPFLGSWASSARVDWMLFQANYLLGNYGFAREMLESALNNGQLGRELKEVSADKRFEGFEQRPEFRDFRQKLKSVH